MNSIKLMGLCLLVLSLNLPLTSANFFGFSPFQAGNPAINGLSSRINSLENLVSSFRNQIYFLMNQFIQPLQNQLAFLQADIAALQSKVGTTNSPKCPSTVTGGVVIGAFCYTYPAQQQTYAAALSLCQASGGTLPEPNPVLGLYFYTALKAALPAVTSPLWIGAQVAGNAVAPFPVTYVTTGQTVPGFIPSPAAATPTVANTAQGVTLSSTGAFTLLPLQTTTNFFACQFPTFS